MIVTFYSFKGGVGRSMALANIGAWLYRQGRRVLLVDWDLEAPGLESFFAHSQADLAAIRAKPGLVDLIESYRQLWDRSSIAEGDIGTKENKAALLTKKIGTIRHLFQPLADTPIESISTRDPGFWLLHAGCRSGASEAFYRRSVNTLDWGHFYDECGGYFFIEWLRRELEKDVDLVLVDSRTGVTEMGGVCTQHLADVVILMFAPNDSNLEGVRKIAELLIEEKVKKLRGSSRPLTLFPIPSRVDTQGATAHLEKFESRFRSAFEGLSHKSLDWCWESKIRYVTSYSYEESILFLEDAGHGDLRFAYERIGDQVLRLQEEKLSPSERENQARFRSRGSRASSQQVIQDRSQGTIQQLISTARVKMDSGDFKTASSLLSSAVALAQQDLGSDHPDTLSAMNNLATSLYAQGDLAGAGNLQEQVLAANQRIFGSDHPDTLTAIANMASLLVAKGDLPGAERFYRRVLETRKSTLGLEHPDTLKSMANLASLLIAKGDLANAEPLCRQALKTQEEVLGAEHPDTLKSLSNLADLLVRQGDLENAVSPLRKALETQERVMGLQHPDTFNSLNILVKLLADKGDLAEAQKLTKEAVDRAKNTLGKNHPLTRQMIKSLTRFMDLTSY